MKFVLFRHAHKGNSPYDDPELSLQGFEQAARIVTVLGTTGVPVPTHLLVSPKRRTSQTFYPLSKEYELHNQIRQELDQRGAQENANQFRNRVSDFLQRMQEFKPAHSVVYACTHYDWIEEAMTLINSDKDLNSFEFSHWPPAQYVVFEMQGNLWKILRKGNVK